MQLTIVHVHVLPGHLDDFIKATMQNHEKSIQEPGNLRFDILQDTEDPTRFALYEVYESETDALAHKSTAHYLAWKASVESWMKEPRKGMRYTVLAPIQTGRWRTVSR